MEIDDKTLAQAKQTSAARKKQLEQAIAAKDAATKLENDLKTKLSAAEKDRKAAEGKVEDAKKDVAAADAFADALTKLKDAQDKQADFEEKERAYKRAECSGVAQAVLDELKKSRDIAAAAAPKPGELEKLVEAVEKQLAEIEAGRKKTEWRKRLGELRVQAKAAEERNKSALDSLNKAMVDADQASEAVRKNQAEQAALEEMLGKGAAPAAA
jgi:hypothetical protein